jgi:hypothetical protein
MVGFASQAFGKKSGCTGWFDCSIERDRARVSRSAVLSMQETARYCCDELIAIRMQAPGGLAGKCDIPGATELAGAAADFRVQLLRAI